MYYTSVDPDVLKTKKVNNRNLKDTLKGLYQAAYSRGTTHLEPGTHKKLADLWAEDDCLIKNMSCANPLDAVRVVSSCGRGLSTQHFSHRLNLACFKL